MFNFLVFPYRDQYYLNKYGCSVRDLHIIESLNQCEIVGKIVVINRPVNVFERVNGKGKLKVIQSEEVKQKNKIIFWDTTSINIFALLNWIDWKHNVYKNLYHNILDFCKFPDNDINILLDFNPMAKIDYNVFKGFYIWYDLIDNFVKHNRFSEFQKELVKEKYQYVEKNADLITGVSDAALENFPQHKKLTVHNKLLFNTKQVKQKKAQFSFGFIGFVTNKFDVEYLSKLIDGTNFTVAIYGKVLDKKTLKGLTQIKGVSIFGKFHLNSLPEIMSTFKIGLIPYRAEKSHDESPIKLYQYLDFGKPVISTQKYEINNEFIFIHDIHKEQETLDFVNKTIDKINIDPSEYINQVKNTISDCFMWKSTINDILMKIEKHIKCS